MDIEIEGLHWEDWEDTNTDKEPRTEHLSVNIELHRSDTVRTETTTNSFEFTSKCDKNTVLALGPRLAGIRITAPCTLSIERSSEVEEAELTAPVWLSARQIRFNSERLVLLPRWGEDGDTTKNDIVVECCEMKADRLFSISNNSNCTFFVLTESETHHPIVRYVEKRMSSPRDPDIAQKFLRMKRILLEFRSHSRGALARFCGKIDGPRVIKNAVGELVRDGLLKDGIMEKRGSFYFLDTGKLHHALDVSWSDLRRGRSSEKMREYLRALGTPR